MLLTPCPFLTFHFAFLPLSLGSLESPWVPYHSSSVLLSTALYTVSVKSAVCPRLKVLCKRTLPLSWMYLYSRAHSAEAAPVLCSSSGEVLSSPHHSSTLGGLLHRTPRSSGACVLSVFISVRNWVVSWINLSVTDPSAHHEARTPLNGASLRWRQPCRGCLCRCSVRSRNSLWVHMKSY